MKCSHVVGDMPLYLHNIAEHSTHTTRLCRCCHSFRGWQGRGSGGAPSLAVWAWGGGSDSEGVLGQVAGRQSTCTCLYSPQVRLRSRSNIF